MRYWSCVVILFFLATTLRAQDKAADPDAINFSARMDTIMVRPLGSGPSSGVRTRDLNGDGYDDIFLNYGGSTLHYGSYPLIRDSVGPQYSDPVAFLADVDGDGIDDQVFPSSIWSQFRKGIRQYPYFLDTAGCFFAHWNIDEHQVPICAADLDRDGVQDLISFASSLGSKRLFFWRGGAYLDSSKIVEVQDSLDLPKFGTFFTAGKLQGQAYFFVGSPGVGTFCVRMRCPLSTSDTLWLIKAGEPDGIAATNLYVTDITGDGIADVLVSDGSYIYIFKGGDDFGSYHLTKSHAYYCIQSPRVLNPDTWLDLTNFGGEMYAAGDLSGSGTPYLCVRGVVGGGGSLRTWHFLYAGGRALDSLYDAIVDVRAQGSTVLDTLHRYGPDAHGGLALRFSDMDNYGDSDMTTVLYRDAEKLPHKPNPNMRVASIGAAAGSISVVPSIADRSIHITTTYGDRVRRGLLRIHDLLGALVESRNVWVSPESETEFVDLSHVASGTYIATVIPEGGQPLSTKFIVQHNGGLNRRLPYTADVPFLPW